MIKYLNSVGTAFRRLSTNSRVSASDANVDSIASSNSATEGRSDSSYCPIVPLRGGSETEATRKMRMVSVGDDKSCATTSVECLILVMAGFARSSILE